MPEREAVRLQLRLEGRPERSGRDPRSTRDAIDLEHPAQVAEIDADGGAVAVTDVRLDAAGDARAAAKRNRGHRRLGRPFEDRPHLALVAWKRHEIGNML